MGAAEGRAGSGAGSVIGSAVDGSGVEALGFGSRVLLSRPLTRAFASSRGVERDAD